MPFFIPLMVGLSAAAAPAGVATAGIIGAGGAVTTGGLLGAGAMAAGITGGVMQAQAASQAGKDQQAMMKYNARVKEEEAKAMEAKAKFDSQRQAEAGSRVMSSLQAEGAPLLVEAQQQSEIDLENLMIGYSGSIDAAQSRNQAQLDLKQGKLYAKAGRNKAMGSYIGAGTTLLSGFAQSGMFSNNKYGTGNSRSINQAPFNYKG